MAPRSHVACRPHAAASTCAQLQQVCHAWCPGPCTQQLLLAPSLPLPQGTKEFPQCGFSNNVVQILRALDAPFESVNILENEMLRSGMKEYSQWPT